MARFFSTYMYRILFVENLIYYQKYNKYLCDNYKTMLPKENNEVSPSNTI